MHFLVPDRMMVTLKGVRRCRAQAHKQGHGIGASQDTPGDACRRHRGRLARRTGANAGPGRDKDNPSRWRSPAVRLPSSVSTQATLASACGHASLPSPAPESLPIRRGGYLASAVGIRSLLLVGPHACDDCDKDEEQPRRSICVISVLVAEILR